MLLVYQYLPRGKRLLLFCAQMLYYTLVGTNGTRFKQNALLSFTVLIVTCHMLFNGYATYGKFSGLVFVSVKCTRYL